MPSFGGRSPTDQARFRNCRVEIWRGGTLRLRFQIPLIKPDVRISRIAAFGQGYLCFRPRPSCAEAFQVE